MELKPGYKQTEMGVIPEEWDVASLGKEVDRLEAGVSVNSVDEDLRSYAHEQAVLKTSAIAGGRFLPHESKKIAPRDIGRAQLNPRFDTIIISRMNTPDLVGECGYVFADFPNLFLPDRLWMTRIRPESKVSVRWLNYLLSSRPYKTRIKELATGTSGSMKNIAKGSLLAMPITYPPPHEQCAIALALSDVDVLIASLEKLIAKKRDLKQAAMQQLLTGQTRLPGFNGEWVSKRLSEVCWFQEGPGVRNTQFTSSGVKLLNGTNIFQGEINLDTTDRFISVKEAFGPYAHFLAESGDIVIASSGVTIDKFHEKVAFVKNDHLPLCMNTSTIRFKPFTGRLDSLFLFQVLMSDVFKRQIGSQATGSAQLNFGPSHVAKVEISLPESIEQVAIAKVLSDMDEELVSLEARLAKTRDLKQGMMQELLTGRTRLV